VNGYRCEKCGADVPPGGWPFCKGGHGKPTLVIVACGEFDSKHLGGMRPKHFTSRREHDRYIRDKGIVPLADTPVTEGERNALERAKERTARYREGRPDKIEPLPQSEAL
jgi:hypothetical protein